MVCVACLGKEGFVYIAHTPDPIVVGFLQFFDVGVGVGPAYSTDILEIVAEGPAEHHARLDGIPPFHSGCQP